MHIKCRIFNKPSSQVTSVWSGSQTPLGLPASYLDILEVRFIQTIILSPELDKVFYFQLRKWNKKLPLYVWSRAMTSSDRLTKTEFNISMVPNSLTPFLCLPSALQSSPVGEERGGLELYQHCKFRDFVTIRRREGGRVGRIGRD